MIMAGGEGKRLHPLTAERSKPSVPFGGRYRIVDFVLSNLVNSGIHAVYLLVQYRSQSLIEHVRKSWADTSFMARHFVTVVPPQMQGPSWFQGTADAVFQNLDVIKQYRPDLVVVFGADHVYRMDVSQMLDFHREAEADVTVAALPVTLDQGPSFGVLGVERDGRIVEFTEKPQFPQELPDRPGYCYASMGNYVFKTEALISALSCAHTRGENDFGKDVLPKMVESHRVYAYDFASNRIPGAQPYEESAYWRDVGTLDAYYDAHKDLLGSEPLFEEFNAEWPIFSGNYGGPAAKILDGSVSNCFIGGGTVVGNARVLNSVVRSRVCIEDDVEIEDSIVMDHTRIQRGARLRGVVVDRYNNILPKTSIGFDRDYDNEFYTTSPKGIVVVPRRCPNNP